MEVGLLLLLKGGNRLIKLSFELLGLAVRAQAERLCLFQKTRDLISLHRLNLLVQNRETDKLIQELNDLLLEVTRRISDNNSELLVPLGEGKDTLAQESNVELHIKEVHFLHIEEYLDQKTPREVFHFEFLNDQSQDLNCGSDLGLSCATVEAHLELQEFLFGEAPQRLVGVLLSPGDLIISRNSSLRDLLQLQGQERTSERI